MTSNTPGSPTSVASTSPSTSLSRSQPLLGSYGLSLLQRRMSQHAPHNVDTFALRLRAVATGPCPPTLRAPPPLSIPFTATYYDLAEGVNTPWVADVDLESWFFTAYSGGGVPTPAPVGVKSGASTATPSPLAPGIPASAPASTSAATSSLPPPPHYPGYRVAPVGQLQILITTPSAAVKAFVVPYDLRGLAVGARLLARERTFVLGESVQTGTGGPPPSPSAPRESLRYAVQLQFVCAAAPPSEAEFGDGRAFYVSRALKLVFASTPLEREADVRDERADEVVPPSESGGSASCGDWLRARKRYLARTAGVRGATKARRAVGFSPPRERPASPLPPGTSPRSLLSALAPDDSVTAGAGASATSPGTTPGSSAPPSRSASRAGDADTPAAPRVPARTQRRRRSWRAERELSERLRALEIGNTTSSLVEEREERREERR